MATLNNSLNLSSVFRSRDLNDPVNYEIELIQNKKEKTSEIPLRYLVKDRKIKEVDAFGGYRFAKENFKKHLNPTDEYKRKVFLEQEILKKKKLLEKYKNLNIKKLNESLTEFLSLEKNPDYEYVPGDDVIKVLDVQRNLLKKKNEIKKLENEDKTNKIYNNKNKKNYYLEEPDVDSQFLAANKNRVQIFKHVQTLKKPEYMTIEELEKLKQEHEKNLLEIEDEYYNGKKLSNEEILIQKENKKKLEKLRNLSNKIYRKGYNNENPLDPKDQDFIKKYNNYLLKKSMSYDKIGYEEEWNNTKIKSMNSNGIVDRNDNLPGCLDNDDYRLYYYDINDSGRKLNFERPLKIHIHSGKENTLKRTFRNEPDYENTKGKFYRTASAPDFDNLYEKKINNNNDVNNYIIKQNCNRSVIIDDKNNNEMINSKEFSFIKMIYGMLSKNENGDVPKNKIISEMKLDENIIKELGFNNKKDLENKLNNFPTKKSDFMTEDEFTYFLLNKGILENFPEEEKLYTISKPQFYKTEVKNNQIINDDEILPGMSTSYFDFLKNPSTTSRLRHINKTLHKTNRSQSNFNKNKKNLNFSSQNMVNKSYDNILVNNTNSYYSPKNYYKKCDLNFTIPEPFEFLKEDYHQKKLIKMKEILEERKKNENDIFKHTFHANPLNRRMFDKKGSLGNIIQREKAERQIRVERRKMEIIQGMKPFSFYDDDFKNFYERKHQECLPPEFVPFKANPIKYTSQANMFDGLIGNSKLARQERIHQRAVQTFKAASLPPRMEMHEKQRKLMQSEKILIDKKNLEIEKKRRVFKAQSPPNFSELYDKFTSELEKKKKSAQPTIPKPFTFHEPKKRGSLYKYLDNENNAQIKNPILEKNKNFENIRKKMQKKPKYQPSSTRALELLMDKRRKDLEIKKLNEEKTKIENAQRIKNQQRLNERVRSSSVLVKNSKKNLLEKQNERTKEFKNRIKENKEDFKRKLDQINQNVKNRPLMMEVVGRAKKIESMSQENNTVEVKKEESTQK